MLIPNNSIPSQDIIQLLYGGNVNVFRYVRKERQYQPALSLRAISKFNQKINIPEQRINYGKIGKEKKLM